MMPNVADLRTLRGTELWLLDRQLALDVEPVPGTARYQVFIRRGVERWRPDVAQADGIGVAAAVAAGIAEAEREQRLRDERWTVEPLTPNVTQPAATWNDVDQVLEEQGATLSIEALIEPGYYAAIKTQRGGLESRRIEAETLETAVVDALLEPLLPTEEKFRRFEGRRAFVPFVDPGLPEAFKREAILQSGLAPPRPLTVSDAEIDERLGKFGMSRYSELVKRTGSTARAAAVLAVSPERFRKMLAREGFQVKTYSGAMERVAGRIRALGVPSGLIHDLMVRAPVGQKSMMAVTKATGLSRSTVRDIVVREAREMSDEEVARIVRDAGAPSGLVEDLLALHTKRREAAEFTGIPEESLDLWRHRQRVAPAARKVIHELPPATVATRLTAERAREAVLVAGGSVSAAATALGVPRSSLRELLKRTRERGE